MYKILVETEHLTNSRQTPFRKIISNTPIQTSPTQITNTLLNIHHVQGRIHLYKNYNKKSKEQEESKVVVSTSKIQLKSQVLFISQLPRSELNPFMEGLKERMANVDSLDAIKDKQDDERMSLVVCFHSVLACEQVYQLVLFNFHALPLYLQEATFALLPPSQDNLKACDSIATQPDKKTDKIVEEQKWIEIPTCLDCLQRLQYALTGFSEDLFQQLEKARAKPPPCRTCLCLTTHQPTTCALCNSPEDNWMCLICSKVGCGRYKNADAFRHFAEEGHCLTLDLESQRVWNYLEDCFAHRVVPLQKQEVTLRFPDAALRTESPHQESLEAAFWQYCSVVSQELQRQRAFYERQREEEQEKFQKQMVKTETLCRQAKVQLQLREDALKKLHKRNKKNQKRIEEVIQSCAIEREILSNYEKTIKQESFQEQNIDEVEKNSQKIQQKLKILKNYEEEINAILIKLTE